MINFFKITTDGYQVMLERSAFYFFRKMPLAFRDCGDDRIFVKDERHGKDASNFINSLNYLGKVTKISSVEFNEMIKRAYNKAILAGSERAVLERFGFQSKEEENVSNPKGNAD